MARKKVNRRVDPATKRGAQGEGGGRQMRVFSREETDRVVALTGYGLSQRQVAAVMRVSEDTMTEIKARQPEVARALENGVAIAAAQVGQTLYQKAMGYSVMRPKRDAQGKPMTDAEGRIIEERVYIREPDLGAAIWWEKTRLGYADPRQLRHADAQGRPLPEMPATVRIYELPQNGRQERLPMPDLETPAPTTNGRSGNGKR